MRIFFLAAVLCCAVAPDAEAHIELLEPTPRYTLAESGENKSCPCGYGDNNQRCSVADGRSDPNRAAPRVTTLTAGSTLLLRFEEYIGHSGRFRVAIDFDGADLEDFNQNILVDIPDPSGSVGNSGQGSIWDIEVPLPNVPCETCTLQLIQVMDGNTSDPVLDPVGRSTYYTCADIELVGGETPAEPDAGAANPDTGRASGSGCQAGGGGAGALAAFAVLLAIESSLRGARAARVRK